MNVELVNPMSVFRLFERSDAARLQPSRWRTPAWAKQLWARLGEEKRLDSHLALPGPKTFFWPGCRGRLMSASSEAASVAAIATVFPFSRPAA